MLGFPGDWCNDDDNDDDGDADADGLSEGVDITGLYIYNILYYQ
jgi:hypothetical protein